MFNIQQLQKLNSKNKLLLQVVLILIINIILLYFSFMTVSGIKNLRNQILDIKIDLENKITRERNMNSLNEKLRTIEPELTKINQIFINQNREIEFITALENLAENNKIEQKININLDNREKGEIFDKVAINLESSGSFQNILNYLSALESLNYYLIIESISFQSNKNLDNIAKSTEPSKGNISVTLNGYCYWK